jgi:GDP-4-dehydro-6-deoxy-D-mannose reductase
MKALVTGAGGFAGRHLVAGLLEAGWRVVTSARHGPADLPGDLLKIPLRGVSVDVVFHLAGFSNPSASVEHSAEAYAGNAATTARVVRETRAGRFVLASSCQVYGSPRGLATERTPVSPGTPYAASKLCAEALALASGKDVVVLRPFNHTGAGQSDAFVCPRIARQIARAELGLGPRMVEMAALAPRRDFFDVRDMVRAYTLAAAKARRGEIYNVATGDPVAIGDVLKLLLAEARVPLKVRARQGVVDVVSGDSSKFRSATGWRPLIPLSHTLHDLLAYERDSMSNQIFRDKRSKG